MRLEVCPNWGACGRILFLLPRTPARSNFKGLSPFHQKRTFGSGLDCNFEHITATLLKDGDRLMIFETRATYQDGANRLIKRFSDNSLSLSAIYDGVAFAWTYST